MHAGTGYDREDPWHGYVRVLRKDTGSMRQAIQRRYKNRGRRYGIFLLAGLVADPNYSTYLRTTRIDKDLSARAVKSDLLLEKKGSTWLRNCPRETAQWRPGDNGSPSNNTKMARDQGSETHTTKGATNVEKWDTFRTSAKRRKEIKRRETKGRKRDRKITRGRRDRKTNRGPRDSYQHWLCRPSVTWIGGESATLTQVPRII